MYYSPEMKRTVFVNLFGGPGTGKSTGATYIFSKLKMAGVNAEYVAEYAKDLCWSAPEGSVHPTFDHQIYIFAKQLKRLKVLDGKVEVVITDSPLALQHHYAAHESKSFKQLLDEQIATFRNINIFLERVKPYNASGRFQTEDEAKAIDLQVKRFAKESFTGDVEGYNMIFERIMQELQRKA